MEIRSNKIAVLGPLGTFTEEAALAFKKKENLLSEIIPYNSVSKVFNAVRINEADFGVVPLENFIQGHVLETLDSLFENGVGICNAIVLPIKHCLIGTEYNQKCQRIMSHPQALAQCSNFIENNFPNAELITTKSTASAIQEINEENLTESCAIGSKYGAEKYNLKIIEEDIGNQKNNKTMFAIISKKCENKVSEKYRTSIAVIPQEDKPGLLYSILKAFADNKINLEMIQSRPDGEGGYIFYIDLEGHRNDENVKEAFSKIESQIKIFGSYPYVSMSK